jgi:hypothetical protein
METRGKTIDEIETALDGPRPVAASAAGRAAGN